MSRWPRGQAEVEGLLRRRQLEYITGPAADGAMLLVQANRTLATAAGLISAGAHSAYVLGYDAVRFACVAILAQQGWRATTAGGHYAVERAVRAQFGSNFRPFGDLRRRRNELEYPRLPADTAGTDEAAEAVEVAKQLIAAAEALIGEVSSFGAVNGPWSGGQD